MMLLMSLQLFKKSNELLNKTCVIVILLPIYLDLSSFFFFHYEIRNTIPLPDFGILLRNKYSTHF